MLTRRAIRLAGHRQCIGGSGTAFGVGGDVFGRHPAAAWFASTVSANAAPPTPESPTHLGERRKKQHHQHHHHHQTQQQQPLNLFFCAPDTESDAAMARVAAAVARLHPGGVRIVGVVRRRRC